MLSTDTPKRKSVKKMNEERVKKSMLSESDKGG